NLVKKYGKKFSKVVALLNAMKKADKAKKIKTEIAFIDDADSMKKLKVKKASASLSQRECKKTVDALYVKWNPAYIVIFGAQDVFPFQHLLNPADDEDGVVPSDLPYACSAPYSTNVNAFTGPSRVVGRIPDVPGNGEIVYITTLIHNIVNHKPMHGSDYTNYFSVSAKVWKRSTELSLKNMFGNATQLLTSPPASGKYTKTQLRQLTHFYNCHGAAQDPNYYGQEGNDYPFALYSKAIVKKITPGTVVAAECCYGAEVFDPVATGNNVLSIANQYLLQNAISFVGSSTISYGPADEQGLADLITQYFIRHILNGASAGRAMLEAQQEFLTNSGPDLDPYELKTLGQFYLLGDPSAQPVDPKLEKSASSKNTIENRRMGLFNKGINLKKSVNASEEITRRKHTYSKALKEVMKKTRTNKTDTRERVYRIPKQNLPAATRSKKTFQPDVKYRAFIKQTKSKGIPRFRVLVVKESNDQVLGWKVYVSR
ncbi:MAG: hypothetical protein C0490_10370, partial [Marivirga sp.]|nr:hypothetical protein [Marivirga sp.]